MSETDLDGDWIQRNECAGSPILLSCSSPRSTMQYPGLKLSFGTRLDKVSPGQYLNPRLYSLLLYLSRCGTSSGGCYLNKISKVEKLDKKEVIHLLCSGEAFCISDYSVRSILHVVRSFLKHLPRPLFDDKLFPDWVSTGYIIHQQSDLPTKKQLVLFNINLLLKQLGFYENLLIRHLIVSLNLLSTNKDQIDPQRVQQLAQIFAPCLIKKKYQWMMIKPITRRNIEIAKVSFVSFLIVEAEEIFGVGIKNIFPPLPQKP